MSPYQLLPSLITLADRHYRRREATASEAARPVLQSMVRVNTSAAPGHSIRYRFLWLIELMTLSRDVRRDYVPV